MKNYLLDFSQNFNVVGPPGGTFEALRGCEESLLAYPSHDATGIGSRAVADFFGISESNLVLAHGATEVLFKAHEFLSYERAIIPLPTFWEYKEFNTRFSIPTKTVTLCEEDGFTLNMRTLEKVIENNDAIFICNINNPTSVLTPGSEILSLAIKYPNNHFIVDETYLLFHHLFAENTLSKAAASLTNVHVVASFSKLFSLPGLRAGVLISDQNTIQRYRDRSLVPYSISTITQKLLSHALADSSFLNQTREYYRVQKNVFCQQVATKLGSKVEVLKPEGNFMLIKMQANRHSEDVVKTLRAEGVIVRGGHELEGLGNRWLRIAVRNQDETAKLASILDSIL